MIASVIDPDTNSGESDNSSFATRGSAAGIETFHKG